MKQFALPVLPDPGPIPKVPKIYLPAEMMIRPTATAPNSSVRYRSRTVWNTPRDRGLKIPPKTSGYQSYTNSPKSAINKFRPYSITHKNPSAYYTYFDLKGNGRKKS